jgi:hypothetical protein
LKKEPFLRPPGMGWRWRRVVCIFRLWMGGFYVWEKGEIL